MLPNRMTRSGADTGITRSTPTLLLRAESRLRALPV